MISTQRAANGMTIILYLIHQLQAAHLPVLEIIAAFQDAGEAALPDIHSQCFAIASTQQRRGRGTLNEFSRRDRSTWKLP